MTIRLFGYPVTPRKLFKRCAYCGGWLKGRGVAHTVYLSNDKGWPSDTKATKYACMRCEMGFDDE